MIPVCPAQDVMGMCPRCHDREGLHVALVLTKDKRAVCQNCYFEQQLTPLYDTPPEHGRMAYGLIIALCLDLDCHMRRLRECLARDAENGQKHST